MMAKSQITLSSDSIISITIDRPGDFYIIDSKNKIEKYNSEGKKIITATLERNPTIFDPWSGVRLFTFFKETREIQYLDPSLSLLSVLPIDSAFSIEPLVACPSGEYNYWLLDQADFSLKKILPRESKVQVEVLVGDILSSPENILHFREYMNYVFILDKEKGIIIFNQLGIRINTIKTNTNMFNFYGEELYYLEKSQLRFFDLFTGETRTVMLAKQPNAIVLLPDRKVEVIGKSIKISDFRP